MADRVREENRDRLLLDEALRLTAQEAEVSKTLSDHKRCSAVHIAELGAARAAGARRGTCRAHERVQLRLLG